MQLPPGGPQPAYREQQIVVAAGSSGLAIASGVMGIISWFICPFVGALIAILTGHIAMSELKRQPYRGGRGWATLGLILGYAHLAIYGSALLLIFAVCGGLEALTTLPQASP